MNHGIILKLFLKSRIIWNQLYDLIYFPQKTPLPGSEKWKDHKSNYLTIRETIKLLVKMQRKTLKTIIVLVIAMTGFLTNTNAQGWSFTFTLTNSGPCGATIPSLPTFNIPFMPTQSFCESLRSQILAIRFDQPMYNDRNQYIGDCSVYYTATACTGSDMVLPTDNSGPGSISIDGLAQGDRKSVV